MIFNLDPEHSSGFYFWTPFWTPFHVYLKKILPQGQEVTDQLRLLLAILVSPSTSLPTS
jgi:hypothetical protein